MRSCSSYQPGSNRALVARCSRTTSAARGLVAAMAFKPLADTSRSSRYDATRAVSVAGCVATGANRPGSACSEARKAAAITGVDTGRRPAAASDGAPNISASRYGVTNVTATSPRPRAHVGPNAPEASSRLVATPTWFDGTTTVTGVSGSSPLMAAIVVRRASAAARPYGTQSTWMVTRVMVRRGCATDAEGSIRRP